MKLPDKLWTLWAEGYLAKYLNLQDVDPEHNHQSYASIHIAQPFDLLLFYPIKV